jgi:LuxR family maltose regulon positive regulatory protein
MLSRLLQEKEAAGETGSIIELLVFQALAFRQASDITSAWKALRRALSLAWPEGYMRVFLDQGQPMWELLRELNLTGRERDFAQRLLEAFAREPAPAPRGPLPARMDTLSGRELEVLRLIASGASNKKIANELVIAIGTVKRHTVNIFNKLGVENRMEAVAKAREMGLL